MFWFAISCQVIFESWLRVHIACRNIFDRHAGWDDVGWRKLGDKLVEALKTVPGNDPYDSDAQ
jgi:hypothetical protein